MKRSPVSGTASSRTAARGTRGEPQDALGACVDRRYAGKLQHHARLPAIEQRRTASPEVCLGSHRQPVVRPDDDDVATNDSFILMPEAYSSCFFI